MIESYNKLRLPDLAKKNDLLIEVNWEPENKTTNKCQVLKLTYPDGKQAFVKKEYFMSFLFAIGKGEEQRKMIPQTITTVRKYSTILGITAKQDIKKGEQIRCAVEIDLPGVVNDVIAEVRGNKKSKSGFILPAKVGNQ